MTKAKKGYKSRLRHPLRPDKRITIKAQTKEQLEGKRGAVKEKIQDYKAGLLDDRALLMRLESETGGPLTLRAAWDRHVSTLDRKWGEGRGAAYWRKMVEPFFCGDGDAVAAELDDTRMEGWVRFCESEGYAAGTIRNCADLMKAALRRAVDEQRLVRLPWRRWKPPAPGDTEREACRTWEEFEAIVRAAAAKETRRKRLLRDLTARIVVTGLLFLRQGEAAALSWEDLQNLDGELTDTHGDAVRVRVRYQAREGWDKERPEWVKTRPKRPRKGRRHATAKPKEPPFVHPTAVKALRHQREELRRLGLYRHDGPVFPKPERRCRCGHAEREHGERCHCGCGRFDVFAFYRTNGTVLSVREFRRVVTAAGLPNPERWSVHSLRHLASLELKMSGDIKKTMALTGHATERTLLTYYVHIMGGDARVAPSSSLPAMDLPALPPARPLLARAEPVALLPEGRREPEQEAARPAAPGLFERAWSTWSAERKAGLVRPKLVTEAAEKRRARAYKKRARELRGSEERDLRQDEREACAAAGRRAAKGLIARWEQFVSDREREVEG